MSDSHRTHLPPAEPPSRSMTWNALLASEIAVSTVINIVFNFVFAWLLFPSGRTISLWGLHGIALDCVPASFVPAVMMTFAISAILRRRQRGGLRVIGAWTQRVPLPQKMLPRALLVGVSAILLVALPTIAVLALLWDDRWGWAQLIPFKLAFSLVHAAIVTPIVLLAALQFHRP